MNYADNGDTPGLLTECTNAKLIGKSDRRDKDTLSKKLYLHDYKKDTKAAMKYGDTRKVPADTNITGVVIYDLLFGPERCALVLGHLLTRVRPEDKKGEEEDEYPRDWLVFFKALTASTFMRWQPNYQRLTLTFLIELTLILKHNDPRCTNLALKRLRWTFSVSEKGDSHKCTPVDLLQEHSMVQQVKSVGRRDPNAFHNLESRVILHSALRLQEIESRHLSAGFDCIYTDRSARVEERRRMSRSIALFWVAILGSIQPLPHDAQRGALDLIQGIGTEESQYEFADCSRVFYRSIDARDHILVAGSAFLKGFRHGYEVAIPPRQWKMLRRLDRARKKRKVSAQSLLATASKRAKIDAEQSLTEDKQVIVQSSYSLLDGVTNAGSGKAKIYSAVLSTMSHNRKYKGKVGQIGDGPSKPVILTRTKEDSFKHIVQRAKRENDRRAPIHIFVDIAKDLHRHIPRRDTGLGNTVIELARDIICAEIKNYYTPGVETICLTMDVPAYMTDLRLIPHAKRGKLDSIKMPHGSLSRVTRGTDDLTPYGARPDLLTCGDQHFIELLFNTICNQARSLNRGDWSLKWRVKLALIVVGGSSEACVVVGIGGKEHIRLNSKSIVATCQHVEDELEKSQVVKSEEGEMMVYAALRTIIRIGFTHDTEDEGIDLVADIRSDDSDAFAGISMQFVYNLESTCILRSKRFNGAIYLHGPKKSVAQITSLGNIFKTNLDTELELCPTGRGFEFKVDLLAVYYTLEENESMPKLPPGHRAITVAVIYTLLNHDYLKVGSHGMTYSKMIATLKSTSYKSDVERYDAKLISPVNMTRQAVFATQNHNSQAGYNLPGILLLFHHAFINRPATKKILLKKYGEQNELRQKIPYDVVRAAAIIAGELQPVPDPVALLNHMSCAGLVFRRWTGHLYGGSKRTDDELEETCYTRSEVKGQQMISIDYNLCDVAKVYRPSYTHESLIRKLKHSKYGSLLPDAITEEAINAMPFNPIEEIKLALEHGGFYPSIKVSEELLPSPTVKSSVSSDPTDEIDEEAHAELLEDMHSDMHNDLVDSEDEEDIDDTSGEEPISADEIVESEGEEEFEDHHD